MSIFGREGAQSGVPSMGNAPDGDRVGGPRSVGRRHVVPGHLTISGTLNSQLPEQGRSSHMRGGLGQVPSLDKRPLTTR